MTRLSKPKAGSWPVVVLVGILLLSLLLRQFHNHSVKAIHGPEFERNRHSGDDDKGLIRHPSSIHYSRHARCRMKCRHIDEAEVQEILAGGTINYRKSELNNSACRNRYAVEGNTRDGQAVRIIFAPCNTEETVVTVIDLGDEWPCSCE